MVGIHIAMLMSVDKLSGILWSWDLRAGIGTTAIPSWALWQYLLGSIVVPRDSLLVDYYLDRVKTIGVSA
jgi:hypothetical protein